MREGLPSDAETEVRTDVSDASESPQFSRGRRVLVVANAFKVNKLPDYNVSEMGKRAGHA